jgi:hypothetical protein
MTPAELASRPSDAQPPTTNATAEAEHRTNLLDIVGAVEKNAIAPALNSFAIEPVNAGINVANGISDLGTMAVNKIAGSNYKAPELSKVREFETEKAESGLGYYSQQICGTAGSFLVYAVAGKLAAPVLRGLGEVAPIGLELQGLKVGAAVRSVAQDTRVASVLGAATYAALKDPKDGESRASNFASTMVGFAAFEAGGRFVNSGQSMLSRMGKRYMVGSIGGALQANATSLVLEHKMAGGDAIASSALASGLLNTLLPTGKRMVDHAAEGPVLNGLPKVQEATARLHVDALRMQAPGEAPVRGSWADPEAIKEVNRAGLSDLRTSVKLGSPGATRIDQSANVVHAAKDASPLSVIQELSHRKAYRDPVFESTFKSLARDIKSNDPTDPANAPVKEKYVQARVQQEVSARTDENAAAKRLGLAADVSVDAATIRRQEGYGAVFEREADDFIRTGGKTGPRVDYESSPALPKETGSKKDAVSTSHDTQRESDKVQDGAPLPTYNLETYSLNDLTSVDGREPLTPEQWKSALQSGDFSVMLSGGGQQGYHHMGFMAALDEMGLHPKQVTGVSAGSTFHALDLVKDSSVKFDPGNSADRDMVKSLMKGLKPKFADSGDIKDDSAGDRAALRTRLQALSESSDPAAQLEHDPSLAGFLSAAKRALANKHALDETFDTHPKVKEEIDLTDLAWRSARPYNTMWTGKDLGDGALHGLRRVDLTQMWWDNPLNIWRWALGAQVPSGIPHITTWDGTQLDMHPAFAALDKRLGIQNHVTPASSFLAYDVENQRVVNFQGNYDVATALTASTAVNVDGNGVKPVEAIINGKHSTLVDLGVVEEGRFNSPTGHLPNQLPSLVSQLPRPASPRRANDLVVDYAMGQRPPFPLVNDDDVLKMFANGYVETRRRLVPIVGQQ